MCTTRDVANGYAVAEILSKYFAFGFELYHFDAGDSGDTRKQNWESLYLILWRKGLKIPMKLVEGTINHREDAAKLLLIYLYEILNKKRVTTPYPIINRNFIDTDYQRTLPLHARANASSRVRQHLREDDLRIYFFPSIYTKEGKTQKIINIHKAELKRLKSQHKDYFQCRTSFLERIPRKPPMPASSQVSSRVSQNKPRTGE